MRVSVISIAYNDASGLALTRASVLAQDHPDVEHIIVDAGSGDGTADWLAAEAAQDATLIYRSERDRGRYDGMNKGARLSSGDLLWWMHAGDAFASPGAISAAVAGLAAEPERRWGYGFSRFRNDAGAVIAVGGNAPFSRGRFVLGGKPVPHQAAFFRRDLYDELGGYDEEFGLIADQLLMLRAAALTEPLLVPEFLCDFDAGGAGSVLSVRQYYWETARARRKAGLTATGVTAADDAIALVLASADQAKRFASTRLRRRDRQAH